MKVLSFDIWGDYGHFRKFYTTTSPLTFSFPPPPTVAGILGAINGLDKCKNEYLSVFGSNRCKISLRLLKPVRKTRIGLNLINTKGNYWILYSNKYHEPRTQIRAEFVKDPAFRIYVSHEDEGILDNLCKFIIEHRTVYTVSLGLSELLANFRFTGFYGSQMVDDTELVELSTPVVASNLVGDGLEIEEGKKYFKERIPIVMNPERVVEIYDDVIYEPEGNTLKARVKTYYRIENGENIAFF